MGDQWIVPDLSRVSLRKNKQDQTVLWTTDDELDFIQRLGAHRLDGYRQPLGSRARRRQAAPSVAEKLAMWRAYRAQMPYRVRWSDIDAGTVAEVLNTWIRNAERELATLDAKEAQS